MLYVVAALALAGPPFTSTYEEAFLDFIDRGEMMAPRLPVFASNDLTYSTGNPVYDSGDDLTTGSNPSAVFYGTHAKTIAQTFTQRTARFAIAGADSQWSGGPERINLGVAITWPVEWAQYAIPVTTGDPWNTQGNNSNADEFETSQWNDTTETSTNNTTNAAILTAEGIGDPSEIPMPYWWYDDPGTGTFLLAGRPVDGDDQDSVWYNETNWQGPQGGTAVKLQINLLILTGGSTTAPTAITHRTQYYDTTGSLQNAENDITDTTAISGSFTLNASNNNAVLSVLEGDVVDSFTSSAAFRPQGMFFEHTENMDDTAAFALGGTVRVMADETTPADGLGLHAIRYAAGENPWMWIHDASPSGGNKNAHGGTHASRSWYWDAVGNPDTYVYQYGHNARTRSGTGFKAASTYQADLFDLIIQDTRDYYVNHGVYPNVVLIMPWYAANMDQDRHDEMIGVIDALEASGRKVLGIDLFNHFGGTDFTPSDSGQADWTTATTFHLDNDNDPEGSGVHPGDQNSARIVAYAIWSSIEAAANSVTNRSRVRDGTRSR